MFGRLVDLLSPLGLMRLIYGGENDKGEDLETELTEEAASYLRRSRNESLLYLKRALLK